MVWRSLAVLVGLVLVGGGLSVPAVAASEPSMVKEREWAYAGITVRPTGSTTLGNEVFVVGDDSTMQRYTRAGKRTGRWNLDFRPRSIATGPDGLLYVTQQWTTYIDGELGGTYWVHVLNRNGQRVRKFTIGEGRTWFPGDIGLDGAGNVFVTDTHDATYGIHRFDRTGTYTGSIRNAGPDVLDGIEGIAVTRSGVLYLADTPRHRILRLAGGTVTRFGQSGYGNGQFMGPIDLAVTSRGTVLVVDAFSRRLQEFSGTGRFLRQVGSAALKDNLSVHADASGRFYVTGYLASLKRGVVAFKPKPKPRVKALAKPVRVKKNRARVQVRCLPGQQCRGTAQVKRGKKVLAKGTYKVRAGKKAVLALKLTKAGKKAARKKPVKVRVVVKLKGGTNVSVQRKYRR